MSGFLRNLLTALWALLFWRSATPRSHTVAHFHVTPFDTGLLTLKSDQYLQFAEAAQVDFMIKTALMARLLSDGVGFVNLAQMVRFARPVRLFSRVRVESWVAYADGRCAWFVHAFSVRGMPCAQVMVKMKFKKGAVTVPTDQVLGVFNGPCPTWVARWEDTLAAL